MACNSQTASRDIFTVVSKGPPATMKVPVPGTCTCSPAPRQGSDSIPVAFSLAEQQQCGSGSGVPIHIGWRKAAQTHRRGTRQPDGVPMESSHGSRQCDGRPRWSRSGRILWQSRSGQQWYHVSFLLKPISALIDPAACSGEGTISLSLLPPPLSLAGFASVCTLRTFAPFAVASLPFAVLLLLLRCRVGR